MKTTLILIFSLSYLGLLAQIGNPKSYPRKDISYIGQLKIENIKENQTKGDSVVVEYEPLNNHEGDCELIIPFNAKANGKLSLSNIRFKGGEKSLQWEFTNNDVMTFQLGNRSLKETPYACRASKGGIAFLYTWIYNTKALPDNDLYVKIYSDDKVAFEFPVYLNFTGWRCLMIAYDEMKPGYTEKSISKMEFYAPGNTEGTLFFDAIVPAMGINKSFSNKDDLTPWRPLGNNHWGFQWKWDQIQEPTIPAMISKEEKQELELIYQRVLEAIRGEIVAKTWNDELLSKLKAEYDTYEIRISESGIIRGKHTLLDEPYFELMDAIANAWQIAPNESQKTKLEDWFVNMVNNMIDQGFAKGHGMGYYLHYGYRTSKIVPSMMKMKSVLKANQLYQPMEEAVLWLYGLKRIFDSDNLKVGNADDFHTLYRTYLQLVQIIDDPLKRSVYLKTLSDYYNYAIDWRNGGALKEHGAHYHHAVHNPNYASRGLVALSEIGVLLRDTRYAFNQNAHETLRNCALAGLHSSYPNHDRATWAMGAIGRHAERAPIGGYDSKLFYNLVKMGTPDGNAKIDNEMASTYTSFFSTAKKDEFPNAKKVNLDGNWSLPHGRNMTHRRNNWTTMVTGISNNGTRNIEAFGPKKGLKSEKSANLSGLFQSFGRMEIYYHDKTVLENGFEAAGFNWTRRDGITVPDFPVKNNRLEKRHYGGNKNNFANGTTIENQNGVYATIIDNNPGSKLPSFPGEFKALKSWFFFDDLMVCLGSNITYRYNNEKSALKNPGNVKEYPVVTTLFQKRLLSPDSPTFMNEKEQTTEVEVAASTDNYNRFIDPMGTGYIIKGDAKFKLIRQNQESFAPTDLVLHEPLYADYATLLIDHGKECENATYEYVAVPNSTAKSLKEFNKKTRYEVLQKDSIAHVVYYPRKEETAYVIFQPYSVRNKKFLAEVDQPSLVMIRENENRTISLSVASCSFNITKPVKVTLSGLWKVGKHQNVLYIEHENGKTMLTIDPDEGMTTQLTLSILK